MSNAASVPDPLTQHAPPSRQSGQGLRRLSLLGGLVLLLGCPAPERIDWLLYNGKIVTLDDRRSIHSAIALHEGRIVEVGDALRSKYRASQEMNLVGRTVIPGFIDSHTHIRGWAQRYIHLPELASIEEITRAIERKAAELGPGEWITGYGWSEDELVEGRRPLRSDLDLAAPHNPVLLTRAGVGRSDWNNLPWI